MSRVRSAPGIVAGNCEAGKARGDSSGAVVSPHLGCFEPGSHVGSYGNTGSTGLSAFPYRLHGKMYEDEELRRGSRKVRLLADCIS